MSASQTSMLYSAALAAIGFTILSVVDLPIASQYAFVIGVVLASAGNVLFKPTNVDSVSANPETYTTTNNDDNNISVNVTEHEGKKTIYVGNLPYRANEAVIKELFEEHGEVHSVRLLKDRQTGKRRGFGFVEMNELEADRAIAALNESEFQQRTLKVREAKDRPENQDMEEEM